MKSIVSHVAQYDTPVSVNLDLTEDEFFYLWALAYSASNGTPEGLRDAFEFGVFQTLNRVREKSPRIERAYQRYIESKPVGTPLADRVIKALREAGA